METKFTEKDAELLISGKLSRYYGVTLKEATKEQLYKAVVMAVRDILLEKRNKFNKEYRSKGGKRVYYLCMEFLVGRSLKTNLYNLGLVGEYTKVLKKYKIDIEDMPKIQKYYENSSNYP